MPLKSQQIILPQYLMKPSQVRIALNCLDQECNSHSFGDLYKLFTSKLGILNGDGFPITAVEIEGFACRARLNDNNFQSARSVEEIGINLNSFSQGRAHASGYRVFYSANRKRTAACEVLQNFDLGEYEVTIGCWSSNRPLRVANLVDGADPDFNKIPFVHSRPVDYLSTWPEIPKQSAIILLDYFKSRFKSNYYEGLYNITNVIARICFSLEDVDGIGYGAVSDNFDGYNIALSRYEHLKCTEVERWLINKLSDNVYKFRLLSTGSISEDGRISW